MHPWHDCYVDDSVVETAFPVVIEITKGRKNKYELDKETGLRGYTTAGSPEFLSPYTNGRAAEGRQERTLRRLLASRPDLLDRLDRVRQALEQRQANA